MNEEMGKEMDGWMDRWMDGQMDEDMDGLIDYTLHGKGFPCASLSINKDRAIETIQHRIHQISKCLLIQICLLGTES